MKICTVCKENKPLSEFRKYSKSKDGVGTRCKPCLRKLDNERYRTNAKRKSQIAEGAKKAVERNRAYVWNYLSENHCVDCGESDPIVLEFDHRDGTDKQFNVSALYKLPLQRVVNEIDKCDVRCANCHKRRTAKQFNHWKIGYTPA